MTGAKALEEEAPKQLELRPRRVAPSYAPQAGPEFSPEPRPEPDIDEMQANFGNAAVARAAENGEIAPPVARVAAPSRRETLRAPDREPAAPPKEPAKPEAAAVEPLKPATPKRETPKPETKTEPEAAAALEAEPEAKAAPEAKTAEGEEKKEAPAAAAKGKAPAEAAGAETAAPAAPGPGGAAGPAVPEAAKPERVTIDASSPGGIIEQLAAVPPTQTAEAFAQAESASATALENQKEEVSESLPEIPTPTGLPPSEPKGGEKKEAAPGAPPKPGAAEGATGREEEPYDTTVVPAPPAPVPAPTTLRIPDAADPDKAAAEVAEKASAALDTVTIDTSTVETSAGDRPNVDVTGEADPAQMGSFEQESGESVAAAKTEASTAVSADFGENNIFPAPDNEVLKAKAEFAAPKVAAGKGSEPLELPPEAVGGLNASLGPVLAERVGAKKKEYDLAEQDFDANKTKARTDADAETERLETETRDTQTSEQGKAKEAVAGAREEWRTEIEKVDKDYKDKADKAGKEHRTKVDDEKTKREKEAAKHLEDAEKEAEEKKKTAEKDAEEKKNEKRKESGGFWGWAKRAASALIDGLKAAVNFIYDNLRKAVKLVFEAAKKLALAAIELARKAIVLYIKAYGAILKGLVSVVFFAFPDIKKKINAKIDKAVDTAVAVVNKAADLLKRGVAAVLDFLASTLDKLLGLIQSIYNGIFTFIGMVIRGEFQEIMRRIGYLGDAAEESPSHLEGAIWEQLIGVDISKPMPGEEGYVPETGAEAATEGMAVEAPLAGKSVDEGGLTDADVAAEPVAEETIEPELVAELGVAEGEEKVVSEQSGGAYSTESLFKDFEPTPGATEEGSPETAPPMAVATAPATMPKMGRAERAAKVWDQIKTFLGQWLSDNWGKLLLAVLGALVGIIVLTIVTGGAIWGALPVIMQIVTAVFVGLTIMKAVEYLKTYLGEGWEKKIVPAAKGLANALAVGIVELVMALGFRVLGGGLKAAGKVVAAGAKAAFRGVKAAAKAATSGIKRLLAIGAELVAKSGSAFIKRGKLIFAGIRRGFAKGVKKVKDFLEPLLKKFRFKKITVEREGGMFFVWGHFNPKVLLASGKIVDIHVEGGRPSRGEFIDMGKGRKGIVVGVVDKAPSAVVEDFKKLTAEERRELFKRLAKLPEEERWAEIARSSKTALNARELRKDMIAMGKKLNPGEHAHHIVPSTHPLAKEARRILEDFGIPINKGVNGSALDEAVHTLVHSDNKEYIRKVTEALKGTKNAAEAEKVLMRIEAKLKAGTFLK